LFYSTFCFIAVVLFYFVLFVLFHLLFHHQHQKQKTKRRRTQTLNTFGADMKLTAMFLSM